MVSNSGRKLRRPAIPISSSNLVAMHQRHQEQEDDEVGHRGALSPGGLSSRSLGRGGGLTPSGLSSCSLGRGLSPNPDNASEDELSYVSNYEASNCSEDDEDHYRPGSRGGSRRARVQMSPAGNERVILNYLNFSSEHGVN